MKINAVYKISDSPLIYASTGASNWPKIPTVEGEPGYLLCHPMWFFSWTSLKLFWGLRRMLKKKNIVLILLHNSPEEFSFAKRFGFRSFLLNQNIHTRENSFSVNPTSKIYDAVYIAAAKKYKRIHLAEKIKKLYIVTYFWPVEDENNIVYDLPGFEPRVSHADYNKTYVSAQVIKDVLNASHCGLALSKKEGAMWATMEYMLTGLPIVSTKSIGGRDFFFDDRYVKIVSDNPDAIKKAVDEFKEEKLDPEWIRAEVLKKVNLYRKDYYEICKSLPTKNNSFPSYEDFYEHTWGGEGIAKLKIL